MRRAVLPCSSGMAPALLAMLALSGCADRFPPPPIINSISPTSGQVDQSQSMEIFGSGFAVRVFTDYSDPNQSRIDDVYVVKVGGVALTGVQHLSTDELTGTLPPGVAQGDNDLEVTDPWARTVTVPAAYFGIPTGGLPTQLAILGPTNVPIGACQQVAVEQRNAAGAATVSLSPTTVTLDTNPASAFGIFSDAGCGAAITSATIDPGQSQVLVYVRATDRVSASLVASSTGLTGATHAFVFGPTRLAFTTAAVTANVGVCISMPLTIETRDPAGAASAVATDTVVNLSAPSNLALFTTNVCGTAATSVTIPAGMTSASFFIKGLAAGTFTITASSTGYTNATQQEVMQNNTIFVFSNIGAQQGVATPFPVTIEAQDGLGNVVTTFTGTAALSGLGGTTAGCAYNCANGTTTTNFTLGGWSGWVSANTAASSAQIHAVSGAIAGDTLPFQVLSPDAVFAAPTARLMVRPGAVNATGDNVTLDARLSSDYGQGALEYSFDKDSSATTPPGTSPWTSWGASGTFNANNYAPGVWQPRVAVRKVGGTTISYASATVVSTSSTFCVVTTTSMVDDGASNCGMSNKWGSDNALSLPEAIALTNGGGNRVITTNTPLRFVFDPAHPLPPVISSTLISFASGTQLVNNPIGLAGTGALLANADLSGAATWNVTGNATIQDTVLHDGASLTTDVSLTLSRVLAFNCPAGGACAQAVGPTGTLQVLFSQFTDAPGDGLRAFPATSGGPCAANAVAVLGSTFTRAGTAIRDDCGSSSTILHATFHGGGTGVSYAGGSGHVLQDSVFSSNASATNCGAATFTTRDTNLLFGNGSDGCLSTSDPSTLAADPLYFLPEAGDLRDRSNSPARDSAAATGLDVNDTAPGLFFGAGPDRGGRETP